MAPTETFSTWGFDGWGDYAASMRGAYRDVWRRAVAPQHPVLEVEAVPMPKTLHWFHVSCLGVGLILGAGIFVSTGEAAALRAGPAVVISFVIAGLSAMLSCLCYSEFAVRFPLSGGAFNYILFSCGELVAFCCVSTLVLEYVLANAAVARSFAPYLGQLVGRGSDFFTFPLSDSLTADPLGAALVLICTALVVTSTEHSNTTNLVITVIHVAVVLMIMIVGFTKANLANVTPFVPPEFGARGIFEGASFVFFSYIGFDCVSTMAEEVKRPARDMPIGIISCVAFVTVIYVGMALSLCLMVPYKAIDPDAAFAAAFATAGMPWMRSIVALGALLGIVTGVLVGAMAVARVLAAVGRSHLVFPFVGHVSSKFQTPALSALVLGLPTTIIALLSNLPTLVSLVSAGTLFVFGMVAIALLVKRYTYPSTQAAAVGRTRRALRTALIAALVGSAAALGLVHRLDGRWWTSVIVVGIHLALTITLHAAVPQGPRPDYVAPLFPYVPSASLLVNAWLCGTLPARAWVNYAIFVAVTVAVYLVYSIAGSMALEEHSEAPNVPAAGRPPSVRERPRPAVEMVRVLSQQEDSGGLVELAPGAGGAEARSPARSPSEGAADAA